MALNRVLEHGRLVKDVELRTVGDDTKVASLRIAVARDRKNKDGERESDFFDVTAWRSTAEFAAQYFAKGDPIIVDGRLQSRTWTAEDGSTRYGIDIVADNLYFGGPKSSSAEGGQDDALPF